jgi:hypothetical protein
MGDGAHLQMWGGVAVILWRQEAQRMQALTCTAQQVSKEKMGSCSPAKAHACVGILTCSKTAVYLCCSMASWPFPRDAAQEMASSATAREQWHLTAHAQVAIGDMTTRHK